MKYYISNLHLFHESCQSIEEMNKTILNNWNSKVTNEDTVYILSDISYQGKIEDLISFVARLKGKKILIRGIDCDDEQDYRYRKLFEEIAGYEEIYDEYNDEFYHLLMLWSSPYSRAKNKIAIYNNIWNVWVLLCIPQDCKEDYMQYTPKSFKEIMDSEKNIKEMVGSRE